MIWPKDGSPEWVDEQSLVKNSRFEDIRAIIEFDISTIHQPVGSAWLEVPYTYWGWPYPEGPRIDVYAYPGDGTVTLSDFAAGALIATREPAGQGAPIAFNVTAGLNALIASKATYAGFNLRLFNYSTSFFAAPSIGFGSLKFPPAAWLELRTP